MLDLWIKITNYAKKILVWWAKYLWKILDLKIPNLGFNFGDPTWQKTWPQIHVFCLAGKSWMPAKIGLNKFIINQSFIWHIANIHIFEMFYLCIFYWNLCENIITFREQCSSIPTLFAHKIRQHKHIVQGVCQSTNITQ